MKDLHNQIKVSRALSPVSTSDDTPLVTQIIDTKGYESLEFLIALGSLADSNATFTVLMEDGDDSGLSDHASVADENLLGTEALASFLAASDDDSTKKIGYRGNKRYVRMTITPSGNGSAAVLSVVAVQGHPLAAPVS